MATSLSSLPIVDLAVLSSDSPSLDDIYLFSQQLHDVFATTGFAYLINSPLSFSHDDVFGLARDFFRLHGTTKMSLAKQAFILENQNTYRGYFPPQPGQQDNLKEGFEVGPSMTPVQDPRPATQRFHLGEPNVWPSESTFPGGRAKMEQLHQELQSLSSTLLSLLAVSLNEPANYFASYLVDSLSTLRLLHYPPQTQGPANGSDTEPQLCCTPHTDSGILTLLHQDPTGGLEVRNADGEWVAAPYVPGSIVVNIGDLLADVSGGRFVATVHRVRASSGTGPGNAGSSGDGIGRLSVPFFFEPGEQCVVRGVDGGEGVVYGAHVRKKMGAWVEFQDTPETKLGNDLRVVKERLDDVVVVA